MKRMVCFFLLSAAVFVILFPILFIFCGSMMGEAELTENLYSVLDAGAKGFAAWTLFPKDWTLESYKELFLYEPGYFTLFWNSVKISLGVLTGQILFAVPAACGFARYRFRGKRVLFGMYILFMMLPFQVLMLPEYLVLSKLELIDTLWAIILPGIFSTFPVFILYNFFSSISQDVIDAARMDGAGEFMIFVQIGIPQAMPGIASVLVLQFLEYWNLIEQPMLFIQRKELYPLSLYLPNVQLENVGVSFVAAFIALIPPVLLFRGGQEYLEKGIAATSVKR